MQKLTCIVCPKGCILEVTTSGIVTGNACPRGIEYGEQEALHPVRTLTTTLRLAGSKQTRLPVKSEKPLPKNLLFSAMKSLNSITVTPPIQIGTIVYKNIVNSGINIVATKNIKE